MAKPPSGAGMPTYSGSLAGSPWKIRVSASVWNPGCAWFRRQRDRFAEREPGVLALLEQCELLAAGLLRKLARRGALELPAYVGLDLVERRAARPGW